MKDLIKSKRYVFLRSQEACVWLTGSMLALVLLLLFGMLSLIAWKGMLHFWPSPVALVKLHNEEVLLGEIIGSEDVLDNDAVITGRKLQLKRGNRDREPSDFVWLENKDIAEISYPLDATLVERKEWGEFYGFPSRLIDKGNAIANGTQETLSGFSSLLEQSRLRPDADDAVIEFDDVRGAAVAIPIKNVVRLYSPNALGLFGRIAIALEKAWEFVSGDPREANTEGGVFPALFGTVLMVFVMTLFVTPFGVLAGIYLKEYAKPGVWVSTIRISVNNLAAVPSIVFGVFGLGFFVYFLGGSIDSIFFADSLPSPTFGTGGIIWASLTLALLTVPTVIVATEEGLTAIPRELREGSYALGATKLETLIGVVIPSLLPSIFTGVILAVSRAAGEVAPLMLTGVVKHAPALAVDASWPFLHLDRKFMHLGFSIYDVGFQSPNVEAAQPLLYATTLLLLLIVVMCNIAAIVLRNRFRRKLGRQGI